LSNVNYSLNHRGVRLISAKEAWETGKNGKRKLSSKYTFVGKINIKLPNLIISANNKTKPRFKGSTYDLNRTAKEQVVNYFLNERGKRNRKTVAYFGFPRSKAKSAGKTAKKTKRR